MQNTWAWAYRYDENASLLGDYGMGGAGSGGQGQYHSPYGDEGPTLGAKRFTIETTTPTTGATSIAPARFKLLDPDFSGLY